MAGWGWVIKKDGEHPWVVVSNPDCVAGGRCLIINLTDPSNYSVEEFRLKRGCHEIVTKDSVLYFPEALETTSAKIDSLIAAGTYRRYPDISGALLKKILNACRQTKHLSNALRHYIQQGEPSDGANG